jgi:hypothetical protein
MGKANVQAVVVQPFFDPISHPYRTRVQVSIAVHVWEPRGYGSRRLGLYGGRLVTALRAGCLLC